ncbi:MAG: Branched-chain amino acid transport system 2 carrier protein [Candidatus Erwinia impunctatus]|nr:Branched-chain amino acid transport system 2 carrier protein [Culicoides impunctatus]
MLSDSGPLFATPRTATVSFEVGLVPLVGETPLALSLYSLGYFLLVTIVALYPGKLLDSVGFVLAPVKIIALLVLGGAVLLWPVDVRAPATEIYQQAAFSIGFTQGYLTMDTLAALVFGIFIVNAARARGVTSPALLTRYTLLAGLIAGAGLVVIYLMLFKLGANSAAFTSQGANGAAILHAFVQHAFGEKGVIFLAALIFIACMVTAVGLTCAGASFFSQHTPLSYHQCVLILALFSMLIANVGLDHLILFSVPVLTAIYPPCIILVVLSLTYKWWQRSRWVMGTCMLLSLVFGVIDALKAILPEQLSSHLPLLKEGLAWLPPVLIVLVMVIIYESISTLRQRSDRRYTLFLHSQENKQRQHYDQK